MPISVALVDDHPLVLRGLTRLISRVCDLEVVASFWSVDNALSFILGSPPDVVVVDLNLGGDSGLRLVRAVRDEGLRTRTLVLSVFAASVYEARAADAGAAGYLSKTSDSESIIRAIRTVASGGIVFSDALVQTYRWARQYEERAEGEPDEVLSPREIEVFLLIGQELEAKEIASRLGISSGTVYKHLQNIRNKLLLDSSRHLRHVAIEWLARDSPFNPSRHNGVIPPSSR